jgi:hypothetical protein
MWASPSRCNNRGDGLPGAKYRAGKMGKNIKEERDLRHHHFAKILKILISGAFRSPTTVPIRAVS